MLILGLVALLLGIVILLTLGGTGFLFNVLEAETLALLFFPFLKAIGMPSAQPFVELHVDGIRYGRKQFVPWESVERVDLVAHLLGKRSLMVKTRAWKPAGPFGMLILGSRLPLSGLDSSTSLHEWLESIREVAPSVPLPSI